MKNNPLKIFILSLLATVTWVQCQRGQPRHQGELQIIHEAKTDKRSPFYIGINTFPSDRKSLPIGIFDSGTGGLTVLNSILTLDEFNNTSHQPGSDGIADFISEGFIYLADEANMPYGNYHAEGKDDFLRELVIRDLLFLLGRDYYQSPLDTFPASDKDPVKMIVIACNTATAFGLEAAGEAMEEWGLGMEILGIIDAGCRSALERLASNPYDNTVIGVLATEGTCASGGYPISIRQQSVNHYQGRDIGVVQQGGIGLAGAIDGDISYIDPVATGLREPSAYYGPGLNHPTYPVDLTLWEEYHFEGGNSLFTEKGEDSVIAAVQLNSVANYIRYMVTHLVINHLREYPDRVLGTVILGCTHYPFFEGEIRDHFMYLKELNPVYDRIIPGDLFFIDPGKSLAVDLYHSLTKDNLWGSDNNLNSRFFITVPNPLCKDNQIDANGEFPYTWKYGREINTSSQFVKAVPFSNEWPGEPVRLRIRTSLPATYRIIYRDWSSCLRHTCQNPNSGFLPTGHSSP